MTLIINQGWPDGHPLKNGGVMIGFVKRRIDSSENQSPKLAQEDQKAEAPKEVSSENQSPKLAQEGQKTEATKDAGYPSTVVGTAK